MLTKGNTRMISDLPFDLLKDFLVNYGYTLKGTFGKEEFILTSYEDLGIDEDNVLYRYSGSDNFPVTVTTEVDPSQASDYSTVTLEDPNYTERLNWNTEGAPYISMKEKLRSSPIDLVGDARAPDDGTGNVSEAFKELLEFGAKRITAPEGIFNFNDPIVIHNKGGFTFEGAGRQLTTLTASSNLLLDTSELSGLPIDYQSEYNKNAIFHVTAHDGASDRPNKAARNTQFANFTVNFEGTPAERVAALMASPQFAHAQFRHITMEYALALAHFWITSGLDSRFYHIEFNEIESLDCVHHVKNDYKTNGGGIVSLGTTWQYLNNTITRCDNGYELDAISYGLFVNSSVDNQKKGAYAYDINKCLGLSIISPGIETRFEKAGVGYGGGMIRIENGSSVDISGGFLVGGDRDGEGTGTIADYGVPAMNLIDNSTVDWRRPRIDCKIDTGSSDWPIRIDGSGFLRFSQGYGEGVFGESDSDFELLGAGRTIYDNNKGNRKYLSADGASNATAVQTNIRSENVDITTLQAATSDIGNETKFDVLARALDGTLKVDMSYRINLGELGMADYTDINFPTSSGPFGILEYTAASNYRKITIDLNNGQQWKNQYNGSSWVGWVQLG